jgi:Flp pilus assembly protein TadG
MSARGQAVVELAVCMPVVLLLGLGVAAIVQVSDAAAGLHAAASAAVAAAARAPDEAAARAAAQARFEAVVSAYPLRGSRLELNDRGFARGATITATGAGYVDLGWEAMAVVPARVDLSASASARIEPWRTR